MKIALVVMPWSDVAVAPLGVATLKAYLEREGIEVDCHYLNIKMYTRVKGLAIRLQELGFLWSEWPFAYHLFGPGGTGEIKDSLDDLLRLDTFQKFLADSKISRDRIERLVLKDIPEFVGDCLAAAPWGDYDLIGFSSLIWSHAASLKLAWEIKKRFPGARIALGGCNVQGEMGVATLKGCEWIDYVVDGEGEEALLALARNIESGHPFRPVPRVSFRRGSEVFAALLTDAPLIDPNSLPLPDHGQFVRAIQEAGIKESLEPGLTFEASRGCWWGQKQHCTFCGLDDKSIAFRSKAADRVAEEVVELSRRHKMPHLVACDNIMAIDHLRDLLPRLAQARKDHTVDWDIFFESKANLTEEHFAALAAAGVHSVQLGIESLSTPILKIMRKGVRGIRNIQSLKFGSAHDVWVEWNVIWGFPGEKPEEYSRMAELVPALVHLNPPQAWGHLRVDRYAPYHFDWRRFGTNKPKPHAPYRHLYPASRFRLEEIAFYFDMDNPNEPAELERRVAPLARALERWKEVRDRAFFACVYGIGAVQLYDSRPETPSSGPELRQFFLEGLEADVFKFCRTIRSWREIFADCVARHPMAGEREVRDALEQMVRRRWVIEEEGSYLNLAIPVFQLPAAQTVSFHKMAVLSREWNKLAEAEAQPSLT